jgi:XRE family aerobic/anaerobic benzoate catabolism transcriptional regulator
MVPDSLAGSHDDTQTSRLGEDSVFLRRLGQRVRAARARRRLSRKLLARDAGVSERYLAQLEAGRGNISILLLRHVADALGLTLDAIVCTEEDALSENDRRNDQSARPIRLALVGLRGAGKSTLGRLLAAELRTPFIELNDEIAKTSGLDVPEIFHLYGPEGYRRFERRCLDRVIGSHDHAVLATAGGIVADPGTYEALLGAFFTVWLRAAPEEHMARVRAQGDLRPMAGNSEAMKELKRLLRSREPLYRRADRVLDTAGRSIEACRDSLVALLEEEGFFAAAEQPRGTASDRKRGAA